MGPRSVDVRQRRRERFAATWQPTPAGWQKSATPVQQPPREGRRPGDLPRPAGRHFALLTSWQCSHGGSHRSDPCDEAKPSGWPGRRLWTVPTVGNASGTRPGVREPCAAHARGPDRMEPLLQRARAVGLRKDAADRGGGGAGWCLFCWGPVDRGGSSFVHANLETVLDKGVATARELGRVRKARLEARNTQVGNNHSQRDALRL